jgi:integrase/recombinase XerD
VTSTHAPFLFDASQTRRLLDAAAALPDNSRARQQGPAHRTLCALCYGLGLRAGEACGLRLRDVDTDRCLLVVRGGKFGKSRLVPHGRASPGLVEEQAGRRAGGTAAGPDSERPPAGRNGYVFHQADNLAIESALSRTLGRWSG